MMCRVFESSSLQAALLPGPKIQHPLSASCAVGEVSFGASTDGLDGTWHFLGLPNNFFVAMYEPPPRDAVYPPTTWTIKREGPFVIHEVVQPAFVCPTKKDDLCVAWSPRQQEEDDDDTLKKTNTSEPTQFFCPDEQALPCVQRGYNSEIYIVNPATAHTLRIGPLREKSLPSVKAAGAGSVAIRNDSCSEEASF